MAAKPMYEIELRGVKTAQARALKIEVGRKALAKLAGEAMVLRIRSRIRSRSGRLASSWGAVLGATSTKIRSTGVVYAKASVRGAHIRPKNARALRFADGGFRNRARINPGSWVGQPDSDTSYITLAFQEWPIVIRGAFATAFGRDMK